MAEQHILHGKTVIITGANGNLGAATVKEFLDKNYRVIAVDGKKNHLTFADTHSNFEFRSVNVSDEQESISFIEEIIQSHGSIDAALLLVGGFAMGNIADTTDEDLHKLFSLNFFTTYHMARPLLQHMKQNGYGRLVFIGARPAVSAAHGKDTLAYALSKSLLFKLAEYINEENKGKNIVASVVAPSTIDTELNRKNMPDANFADWVKPEKIAVLLEFICSDNSDAVREPVYKLYNNS